MDARRAAAILAACNWLKKQISLIEADAKPHLQLQAGESKNAEMPFRDGTAVVGKVIEVAGRKTVSVEDWDGLSTWVEERWPDKVGWYPNPEWWKEQTSAITKAGAFVDKDGEVCPYLVVLHGDSYSMTKLDKDVAEEVFQSLLASGGMRIGLQGEPQLELEETKPEGTEQE